jgi:hypothetical protein
MARSSLPELCPRKSGVASTSSPLQAIAGRALDGCSTARSVSQVCINQRLVEILDLDDNQVLVVCLHLVRARLERTEIDDSAKPQLRRALVLSR